MSAFRTLTTVLLVTGCDNVFLGDPHRCWNDDLKGDDDGDGTVDGCDFCPIDPGVAPLADSDDDGVPDACDPTTLENTVVVFDTFDNLDGWTDSGGIWRSDNGDARQSIATPTATLMRSVTAVRHPAIDGLLTNTLPDVGGAGIFLRFGAADTRVTCSFHKAAAPTQDHFRLSIDGMEAARIDVVGGGQAIRLRLIQDEAGTFQCRGVLGTSAELVATGPTMPIATATQIGLATFLGPATFRSITVFATR